MCMYFRSSIELRRPTNNMHNPNTITANHNNNNNKSSEFELWKKSIFACIDDRLSAMIQISVYPTCFYDKLAELDKSISIHEGMYN